MNLQEQIQKAQAERKSNIMKSFINQGEDNIEKAEELLEENPFQKAQDEDETEGKVEVDEETQKAIEAELQKAEEESKEEAEEEVKKSESDDETEDKEEVEKSDVYNALNSGGNIKFTKSGKEIKENVTTKILPALNAELATKKVELDKLLALTGAAPTRKADNWYCEELGIDVPYKRYGWDETYFNQEKQNTGTIFTSLSPTQLDTAKKELEKNYPASKEVAEARDQYNNKVREICEILVDMEACKLLSTLKDDVSIDLTPKQVICFKFN